MRETWLGFACKTELALTRDNTSPKSRKVNEKLGKTGKLLGHDSSQDEPPPALDSWMKQTFRTAWLRGMD